MLVEKLPTELNPSRIHLHAEAQMFEALLQQFLELFPALRSVGPQILQLAECLADGRPDQQVRILPFDFVPAQLCLGIVAEVPIRPEVKSRARYHTEYPSTLSEPPRTEDFRHSGSAVRTAQDGEEFSYFSLNLLVGVSYRVP